LLRAGDEHASYIASGLTALKNDKRAIFSAAAHAQKAVEFLHRLQAKTEDMAARAAWTKSHSAACSE